MNDPGLDEPIDDASKQVQENVDHRHKRGPQDDVDEAQDLRSFLMPTRWWYASTAFPLIAGTFGPMANAFSICALVENWRVQIPPGGTEEHGIDIPDPHWLIAVNALSLVSALAANLSLLLNMARRVPFRIAQPITITGFWVASVLLIALISVASHAFAAPGVQDQALTQAYYYAIFAAALYQIISYLMCLTVYGAYRGHYSRDFKLTMAQRTLMLQTISFLVYQLLGALVFSKIEGWKFLDAVYWADFTSLTIGIGADFVPTTHLGRSLLFPFAIGGITILGLVVGSIRSMILDRGKKKMAARLTEKTRVNLVQKVEKATTANGLTRRTGPMGLEKETAAALTLQPGDQALSEKARREAEFEAMRRVQQRAITLKKYYSLMMSTFAFAFLWTIGALVFYHTERNQRWSYFESLYFAYTSLLTIGYGDFQPISNSGKPFFVFWSLLAVPTLTILISDMGDTVVKTIKEATIWLGEITVLPSDEDSTRERLKAGLYNVTLGKIDSLQAKSRDLEASSQVKAGRDAGAQVRGQARPSRQRRRRHADKDRLAADFEEHEKLGEAIARSHGEVTEEVKHRYRRTLIAQIRRVYNDSAAATPKKYSYAEWAYFLRLLGEDENDASYHIRPRGHRENQATKPNEPRKLSSPESPKADRDGHRQASTRAEVDGARESSGSSVATQGWSWIGNQSPLMGDKEESEWLIEKLFQRLEESLRDIKQEPERRNQHGES
ncbi:hypothetical protein B0A52_05175 [Exophiala mesophila]|uniref:Potassium channel domain-containing protein n=1 Tax=Exophiala mesophila TaxID=212818 RepID=A0A438N469_EXOME|nr:hypothetical protein B0A52_05175 [Exophiala mesophila]